MYEVKAIITDKYGNNTTAGFGEFESRRLAEQTAVNLAGRADITSVWIIDSLDD